MARGRGDGRVRGCHIRDGGVRRPCAGTHRDRAGDHQGGPDQKSRGPAIGLPACPDPWLEDQWIAEQRQQRGQVGQRKQSRTGYARAEPGHTSSAPPEWWRIAGHRAGQRSAPTLRARPARGWWKPGQRAQSRRVLAERWAVWPLPPAPGPPPRRVAGARTAQWRSGLRRRSPAAARIGRYTRQVIHTPAEPPNCGSSSLAIMGCTRNSRNEPQKMVSANSCDMAPESASDVASPATQQGTHTG